ncbi:hypothetical protein IHE61_00015 [Streptomyces sp. GKU 257-1]|nr:hypothetical protein [Streptomyces sp. GKU 257-1]
MRRETPRESAVPHPRGGATAEELRRKLGGFQQGAREGLRDAGTQAAPSTARVPSPAGSPEAERIRQDEHTGDDEHAGQDTPRDEQNRPAALREQGQHAAHDGQDAQDRPAGQDVREAHGAHDGPEPPDGPEPQDGHDGHEQQDAPPDREGRSGERKHGASSPRTSAVRNSERGRSLTVVPPRRHVGEPAQHGHVRQRGGT